MSSDGIAIPPSPPCPPPLPPPPLQPTNKTHLTGFYVSEVYKGHQDNVVEINPMQEMYYAIKKLPKWREEDDTEEKSLWLAVNSYVSPLIQEGPTCGLVVIKLACSLLHREETEVDHLLQEARRKNYTHQGEMFSAENMLELATTTLRCTGEMVSGGLQTHTEKIFSSIQRLRPVLVPYDADFNHEPTCRSGHRAHWSLLTGYLIRVPQSLLDVQQITKLGFTVDPSCPNLYLTCSPLEDHPLNLVNLEADDFYVFTRQGKSKHLGLWSFSSLVESNNNLKEFSPSRDDEIYIIPTGGVEQGLCGKALILHS